MNNWIDTLMVLVILSNLILLGSSRLAACIRIVAFQGIILGFLPLLAHEGGVTARVLLLAVWSITLKGIAFPWLLSRDIRDASVRREVEPFVGFTTSLLAGSAALAVSVWIGLRLPLPVAAVNSSLTVPVALFTSMTGLFVIVSRKKALNQVLGYLALENGIYIFGVAFVQKAPFLVELGILLDVFVAVFVMGIMVFHINREFDHIDTDQLSTLKE